MLFERILDAMKATLKVKITLQVGGGVAFKATRVVDNLVLHLKTVTNGKKTFVFSYVTHKYFGLPQ